MKRIISLLLIGFFVTFQTSGQTTNNPAPYCLPQYGTVCTGPGVNDFIASFWTTGGSPDITNMNSGCNLQPNNYILDLCNIAEFTPGQTFTVNMISSAPYSQGFAIWIDWNDDGVFDNNLAPVGERVFETGQNGTTPHQGTVQVPVNQPCGTLRMRVRSNYISFPQDPCSNQTFGEVEDYNIFVSGPGCTPPNSGIINAQMTLSENQVCPGESIDLEVLNGPYSNIQWFESSTLNGSYTAINGATSLTHTFTVNQETCFYSEVTNCNTTDNSDTLCVTLYQVSEIPDSITSTTFTNAFNENEICVGDSAELIVNGGVLGSGADWYWYEGGCGNGTPIDSGSVITVSPATTTTYYARAEGDCGNSACEEIEITVHNLPNVNAGSDVSICNTDTVNISATGGNTYQWNNGLGSGDNFDVNPSTTTEYIVVATAVSGCVNEDTVVVTVNPLPTVNVPADIEVCAGTTLNISATGADTYDWDNGIQNGVDFTQPVGTEEYTVIGTDVNGCRDTNSIEVTVFPNPVVNAGNDLEICDDESVTLTANGASTYVWDNGIQNGIAFSPTQTNTYVVEGTDINGCTDSDTVDVVVYPIPDPQVSVMDSEGCFPFTGMFNNLTTGLTGTELCTWEFGDGATYIGCEDYGRTYQNPGCYDVTLTINNNGCIGTNTFDNLVCINPSPVANFNFNPAIPTTTETTITFNNFSSGAIEYDWTFGNVGSSEAEDPVIEFPQEQGNYPVTLIATNEYGCTDTATSILTIFEDLIFYVPNSFTPDGDSFNDLFNPVMTSGFDVQEYHLLIFNRWGEIIFESRNPGIGWDGTFKGKAVKEGTYLWKIDIKVTTADERREFKGHVNVLR